MNGEKFEFRKEGATEKIKVIPAEKDLSVKNCIEIIKGQIPTATEIARAAIENEAYQDNHEEDGDDMYLVRFPEQGQEWLSEDGIIGKLRALSGERGE